PPPPTPPPFPYTTLFRSQVVVQLNVPPASPPGSYSFRLDAVSEVNPDEDFTEGPSVAFDVAAPPPAKKKKFPWWILIVVGAIVRSEEHTSELQSRGHLVC